MAQVAYFRGPEAWPMVFVDATFSPVLFHEGELRTWGFLPLNPHQPALYVRGIPATGPTHEAADLLGLPLAEFDMRWVFKGQTMAWQGKATSEGVKSLFATLQRPSVRRHMVDLGRG
jgi:hypothetical protein